MNSEEQRISEKCFWNAINVYLKKPHVVNKRLWGAKTISKFAASTNNEHIPIIEVQLFETLEEIEDGDKLRAYICNQLHLERDTQCPENHVDVILIELFPKTYSEVHAYNLVCLHRKEVKAIFFDLTPKILKQNICPNFTYSLELRNKKFILNSCNGKNSKSYQWLNDSVLPQLNKWAGETVDHSLNLCSESLSLVSNDKYYTKYNELKLKYGKEMVKIWPECTDPVKFVYEDIAIATYLILLWEEERKDTKIHKLQSFVDLGCGNGLLVYILASEGHPGMGIDVRKRNIWDMYPMNIKLVEKVITPSDINLFPESDWIIGNHSDELTPWVPVVAARSSYKCRFFLLPCCAFNFDGTKYQRRNSSRSQYAEYLEYIKNLCTECGFKIECDRLKIPSTKRICLIGKKRKYPIEEHHEYCSNIQCHIINTEKSIDQTDSINWISNFKAREPMEKVRNCTQIDKDLIDNIVKKITKHLLEDYNLQHSWYSGKHVNINELAELIPPEMLKKLKTECGGLQTLLKNNHHIFNVQYGKVQLRYPKTVSEIKNNDKSGKPKSFSVNIKKKPCWFYSKHPQGCPLTDENCSFLHVKVL